MGCPADARCMMFRENKIIMIAVKVHMTVGDEMLHCGTRASNSVGPDFKRLKFRGARHRLAAAEQPQVSSVWSRRVPRRPTKFPKT
jgi:hypothetical protein